PNNPPGTPAADGLVADLEEAVGTYGGLLVVDEAYGEFAHGSAADLVSEDRSLVVSRTFSKTWAMAGARLGYLIAPTWCVAELEKVALPYHLDALKLEVGVLALDYADEMLDEVVGGLREMGRDDLADRITTELIGLNVVAGRWSFQVVEEYDDGYYRTTLDLDRAVRDALVGGRRHLMEAEMKEQRRTRGRPGHAARPHERD
ncbi:aminotransferase class I/II-fold pyridoxal phosphate-dependent enzyme, partial [Mycolicibacterium poriferae]|uniref:aminotransferase class I/II-fold pyridoxal phosphate-dependent enzyme n=1 Tax=Mycolicibacterium poriferae TaxID=39694 RepID=UPI0032192662